MILAITHSRNRKQLTIAALLILSLTMLLCAWFLLSRRRAAKTQRLLERAGAFEASGDWASAEILLRRCVAHRSSDAELSARVGRAIREGAVDESDLRRAIPFYAKALRLAPQNLSIRLCLAELLVSVQPREAIKHASAVIAANPQDASAMRVRTLATVRVALASQATSEELVDVWDELLKTQCAFPGDVEVVSAIVDFGQRYTDTLTQFLDVPEGEIRAQIDHVMDQLVVNADDESDARMRRHLFRRRYADGKSYAGRLREDLNALLELRPQSNVVRLLSAGLDMRLAFDRSPLIPAHQKDYSQRSGESIELQRARELLDDALVQTPDDRAAALTLAQLHWWTGRHAEATRTLEKASGADDNANPILRLRLAETAITTGQWTMARGALTELDRIRRQDQTRPSETGWEFATDALWVQWFLGIGNPDRDPRDALSRLDDFGESELDSGQRALWHYLRGMCWSDLEKWALAESAFSAADRGNCGTALPQVAAAYAMSRQGRYAEACAAYRKALRNGDDSLDEINAIQIWIELARCSIADQAGRLRRNQSWRIFDQALQKVDGFLADSCVPLSLELDAIVAGRPASEGRATADLIRMGHERFSNRAGYWKLLARHYLRSRQFSEASRANERYEEFAGDMDSRFRLDLAAARGKTSEAIRHLASLSDESPEYRKSRYVVRHSQILGGAKRFEDANSVLNEWLERHPDDMVVQFQIAQLAWQRGDLRGLQSALQQLERSAPEHLRERQICQTQCLLLKHLANGETDVMNSLQQACGDLAASYPNDRRVRVLQAVVAEHVGESRSAVRALREAVRCGEDDVGVLLRLAALLRDSRQFDEAFQYCLLASREAVDCRPALMATQILLSGTFGEADSRRAERLFEQTSADSGRPGYDLFLMNLAVLRERQGRAREAIALTRDALQFRPESIALKNNLAWFLSVHESDHSAALQMIDEAIDKVGPKASLLDTRGMVLLGQQQTAKAIDALERSVRDSDVPSSRYLHLAEAYHHAGRIDEASIMLGKAEQGNLLEFCPRDRKALLRLKVALP